jgi:hypothetical protein
MGDPRVGNEIWAAIHRGDVGRVVELIGGDRAILDMDTPFGTHLRFAASEGRLEIVERLVAMGADLDRAGGAAEDGPLAQAASEGHREIVRVLLDAGAKIDARSPETHPLYAAIVGGHAEVARLLLERGAPPRAEEGPSALDVARRWSRSEIAEMLAAIEGTTAEEPEPIEPPLIDPSLWRTEAADAKSLDQFRRMVAEGARRAFGEIRAESPGEAPYAFALTTTDDVAGFLATAGSEAGYARRRAEYDSWDEASLLGNFRWSPFDWDLGDRASRHLDFAWEFLDRLSRDADDDPDAFVTRKAFAMAAMILALGDLEAEGFFGKGADRESITVVASVADSSQAAWLEDVSARLLNPPSVYETFRAERIAYLDEPLDDGEVGARCRRFLDEAGAGG